MRSYIDDSLSNITVQFETMRESIAESADAYVRDNIAIFNKTITTNNNAQAVKLQTAIDNLMENTIHSW